jgi:superkiller protein 3
VNHIQNQDSNSDQPADSKKADGNGQAQEDCGQASLIAAKAHALAMCNSGQYTEAEKLYRHLIKQGFDDASIYCNLANICRLSNRETEGLELLHKSIQTDPHYASAYYNLGVAYHQDGNDAKQAIRFYRKALALNGHREQAFRNQGIAFLALGRALGGFICLKRYFCLNPKEPELLLDVVRLNDKFFSKVIAVYQQRLEQDPTDANTSVWLGLALREEGMLEEGAVTNAINLSASPSCIQLWVEQAM